jgi:threonine aldolase
MRPPRIDLRSDTVTSPTAKMRAAMAAAEVGDDGYGEDPTVRTLEERFAQRVGKEAAIFVPSGVMGNQIAMRLHTAPGDLVVAGRRQHIVSYERGASGRNAGVEFVAMDDTRGQLDLAEVREALEDAELRDAPVGAIFIESTHMASGGLLWELPALDRLAALVGALPIHLDGARLFNAEVASGIPAAKMAHHASTVMCCLSKGLCAPVGSLLAGSADVIGRAVIERKRLGGAMRQAGVLAACGMVALDEMIGRLGEDHRRARRLADVVAQRWPDVAGAVAEQRTNLVVFAHDDTDALLEHLAGHEIGAGVIARGVVRLVCHAGIDDAAVDEICRALATAP